MAKNAFQCAKGVLSFALKSTVNGLNTPSNLKRWGIKKTNKCLLCTNYCDLSHIIGWCKVSLNQGRLTWRHNSVLHHLYTILRAGTSPSTKIYADIPNLSLNGGTIPPNITVTGQRPDLVLVNEDSKTITLLELTVPLEKNIPSANLRKELSYMNLVNDIQSKGWRATCLPLEVGALGHVSKKNINTLNTLFKIHNVKKYMKVAKDLSRIALLCSYTIFQAHKQPTWTDPPYISP